MNNTEWGYHWWVDKDGDIVLDTDLGELYLTTVDLQEMVEASEATHGSTQNIMDNC